LGQSPALTSHRAAALELAAVPTSRIAAATRAGAGGAPQARPVTKADQDSQDQHLAHEILMGMIRSIPTDPGMDHPVTQAIVFRQFFPPPHDRMALSFFGGIPIAPPSFAWPCMQDESGAPRPLHFVMQIDCAEVPADARLGALPERGVIYVFLDLDDWPGHGCRVLHADEPGAAWSAVAPPAGLPPLYGKGARHVWRWTEVLEDSAARCPNTLPKWPFRPIAIPVPAPVVDQSEDEDAGHWWPGEKVVAQALLEAQGEDVVVSSFSDVVIRQDRSVGRPFETYPHDWHRSKSAPALS
jgi:hypothetical protein